MRKTTQPTDPRTDYCNRFETALRAGLRRRREPNVDDVVQMEQEALLARFGDISGRYRTPEVYAAVRIRAAMENHRRNEGKQSGRGTRFSIDENGQVRRGRLVLSGDAPLPGAAEGTLFDTIADRHGDPAEFVPARVDDHRLLDAALLGSAATDIELLHLAYGHGFTDEELATRYHVARETVNRRKHRGMRQVQGRLSADDV